MIVTKENYHNIYHLYRNHLKLYDLIGNDRDYDQMTKYARILRDYFETNKSEYHYIDKESQFNRFILINGDVYKGQVKP